MLIELSSVSLLDGVLVYAKMLNKRLSKEQGELYATPLGVIYKPEGKNEALIPYARIGAVECKHPDAFTAHFLGVPVAVSSPPRPLPVAPDSVAEMPKAESSKDEVSKAAPASHWSGRRK